MEKCSKSQLSVGDRQYSINYDRKQRTEHLKPNERRSANQQSKSYSKTFVCVSEIYTRLRAAPLDYRASSSWMSYCSRGIYIRYSNISSAPLGQRMTGSFQRFVVDSSLGGRVWNASHVLPFPFLHVCKGFILFPSYGLYFGRILEHLHIRQRHLHIDANKF